MPGKSHYTTGRHLAWREKVLRKDKYLCQECKRYGRKVAASHAHHVMSVEEHPELAYKIANGISLCGGCHNKIEPRIELRKRNGKPKT